MLITFILNLSQREGLALKDCMEMVLIWFLTLFLKDSSEIPVIWDVFLKCVCYFKSVDPTVNWKSG